MNTQDLLKPGRRVGESREDYVKRLVAWNQYVKVIAKGRVLHPVARKRIKVMPA